MGEHEGGLQQTGQNSGAAVPITHAQFLSWKRQKDADESARRTEAARKREEDIRTGVAQMNGRELFVNEPWVFDNNIY